VSQHSLEQALVLVHKLKGHITGLEARIQDLELALHDACEKGAEAQVQAEIAEATIARMRAVLAESEGA
jgi:hypothetical protein